MIGFMAFQQEKDEDIATFVDSVDEWLADGMITGIKGSSQSMDINGKLMISFFYTVADEE